MNEKFRRRCARLALAVTTICSGGNALAQLATDPYRQLSAEWWQWALSIPQSINPVADANGANCMVGQRGDTWFLAGNFGGTTRRSCTLPVGAPIFFPVYNTAWYNSPGICGSPNRIQHVPELRQLAAQQIATGRDLVARLDNKPLALHRAQSDVFVLAIPADNVNLPFCPEGFPAGLYSPSVSDGYWVLLRGVPRGVHTLEIQGHSADGSFTIDVSYVLNIVHLLTE